MNLLFEHTGWTVPPLRALDQLALRLTTAELVDHLVLTFSLTSVDKICACHSWLLTIEQSHLLHFFLHLLNISIDAAFSQLDLRDLLVYLVLVLLTLFVLLA